MTPNDLKLNQELFNIDAEQAILGTIILNNEYLNRVSEFLQTEHFYFPAHQKIYERIVHNIENISSVANQVTLKNFFEQDDSIKEVGGVKYLGTLLGMASSIVDISDYGRLIQDLALKRELFEVAGDVINRVKNIDNKTSAIEQIEIAESHLFKLSEAGTAKGSFKRLSTSMTETMEKTMIAKNRDSHVSGITTGLVDLDKILGGMQETNLIILAGRPSIGKTALGINIAINACKSLNKDIRNEKEKKAVGFFSLEMSAEELSARILSMESSVNAMKFKTGKVNEAEWRMIVDRKSAMSDLPFFIDDTPALSIAALRSRARRMVRKHNLSFLVVDYLQLLRGSLVRSYETRVQEISEITQGLKAIAKEFNIPVMALSQLSRAVEQREDKRPQLSDLRESGSIEQDADVVAFIYRESYYHERKKPEENDPKFAEWNLKMNQTRHLAEVMVAKQRNGPIGIAHLYFDAEFTRFQNLKN
ncbi:MAG: replicative DNA helicase [Proteobacteria bacterium]|nr:replicative DNA helicase [Pseudomonadota bacterium]